MKSVSFLFWLPAAVLASGLNSLVAQPFNANLLNNSGAESGSLAGWSVLSNGGDGWSAGLDGGAHSGSRDFTTSYAWDVRSQTVDLLGAGFTAAQLDAQPAITCGEWFSAPAGGKYFLNVELLGASGDTANPIASFMVGSQSSPQVLNNNTDWFEVANTFSDYGTGVRYIYFQDGGMDTRYWAGNYGTHFDDANASVVSAVPEPGSIGLIFFGAALILFTGAEAKRRCPSLQ